MSIEYSSFQDKHIDTDKTEVYTLSNGDVIEMDDGESLLAAFDEGLISHDEMLLLGFDERYD